MSSFGQDLQRALEGTYEIERELGRGTSATVYLARSVKHNRLVALKVLRSELSAVVGIPRFLREIETAARLTHPHILPLLDSDEAHGLLYFVSPYIAGGSLRERLERDRIISVAEAIRLTSETAGALDYAHRLGIVHRDIKPENILLQDERAIVADFGISLSVGQLERKRLTESGLVVGTPWYMSPEQADGSATVDSRSDVYSLGCVLFELLVGEPPFTGPTPQAVLVRHLAEAPPLLRQRMPDASRELEECVARALAKDPAQRFSSAREFADALSAVHDRALVPRRQVTPRRTVLFSVLALLGMLAIASYWKFSHTPFHERDWLVVADFEGLSSDRDLAIAFRELVTAELNRSHIVGTVSRQQLNATLHNAGLSETTSVNSDLARELAIRTAVRGVVSGSIHETSAHRYDLTVRVVNSERGTQIISISRNTDSENVLPAIAEIATQLRREIGERRSTIEADRPLLDIATPSLPAYRSYVDALSLKQAGDIVGSNRALGQALVRDTGFASAWALLGLNYIEQRNLDSAQVAIAEALKRPERLSNANRFRIQGDGAYAIDYDLEAAVKWYELYLRESPRSVGGRNNYGLYLSFLGKKEEALAQFERASSDNPLGPDNAQSVLLNETAELITLGRVDRARAVARELTGPFSAYAQIQLANVSGDREAAESLATVALHTELLPGWLRVEALTTLAAEAVGKGKLIDADQQLRRASLNANGAESRWYADLRAFLTLVSRTTSTEPEPVNSGDSGPGVVVSRGLRECVAGDTVNAKRALQLLRARPTVDSARLGQSIPVLQGLVDRAGGRWPEVIARLSVVARRGENDATNLDRLPALWSRWLVADAYAHQGHPDSASAYFNLAIADTGIASGHLAARALVEPFARLELAREYDLMRSPEMAVAQRRVLKEAWADADTAGARILRDRH